MKKLSGNRVLILIFSTIALIMAPAVFWAQTADQHRKPLKDVLSKIEATFDIELKYSDQLVDSLWLDQAERRIKPYDLEQTLARVLFPFDLDYVKESDNTYRIKKYEYYRRPVEEGKKQLGYLSSLYNDRASWEKRRNETQSCIRQTLGLNSLPEQPDSKPIISNRRKHKNYIVENVAIETLPGLYVAGSLYRPTKSKGLMPAILNPNGHFTDGRYRADMQIRCAMQAQMGAVAFSYDLFAWGESLLQFDKEDHRTNTANTIQALNGIRILDFLLSLEGVDPARVAITGGSGGGSQTMLLAAIDDRIKVSVPVVMTSSHFDGGCPCESGNPIHVCGEGTNNAELAAMAAPNPQLIISDGKDWTHTVPELEFPFIKRIYGFYNAKDVVKNVHLPDEGHDYGISKRMAMYKFMADHLGLSLDKVTNKLGEIEESGVVVEDYQELYSFGPNGELLPANAIQDFEKLYQMLNEKKAKNQENE